MVDEDTIRLWNELKSLYEITRSPVPTVIVADFAGYSDRHVRRKLAKLQKTYAVRKAGERGGWVPVAPWFDTRQRTVQLPLPLFN